MYRRLMEHLTTAVLLLDDELQLSWMNPAAEALLAVSLGRVKGHSLTALLVEDDGMGEVLAKARDDQHPFTQREVRLALLGGAVVTIDYTVTPLSAAELLVEMEPRDRLLRISREEALLNRQEAIKVLSRGLAHEVKNPLGGIRGAAQLLERDLDDPALREFTHIIVEEVDRLRDLVDSMLGPNKLLRHEPLNVHKVLERVRTLLSAETPGVSIERDYDPSLPDFPGDEAQMIQAVLNVARNAVEAMTEAGTAAPSLLLRTRARRQFTLGAERHRLVCEV
ncbi:MAG: nitrogen regulation protein NR(II), partial [Billgrantia desiderata]